MKEKEKIVIAVKEEEVLAVGKGALAEEILKKAEEHKVPVVSDEEKAEKILGLPEDTHLPPEIYGIISEILRFLSKANSFAKAKGGEALS